MNTQPGNTTIRRVRIAIVSAAVLLAVSHPTRSALAQSFWINPGFGAWDDIFNWSVIPASPPHDPVNVEINNGGKARIFQSDDVYVRDLYVGHGRSNSGTLEVFTRRLDVGGILWIGDGGRGALHIYDELTSSNSHIGFGVGGVGSAQVSGFWLNKGDLFVGDNGGTGSLEILSGGDVRNTYGYLGFSTGSTGTATVNGADSNWSSANDLSVGHFGTGARNITDGGQVANNNANIGANSGASGVAHLYGLGSRWTNHGVLAVGSSGPGTLNITGGGVVTSGLGRISRNAGSTGSVLIDGPDSRWDASLAFTMGLPGTGTSTLTVQDGGVLSVALGMTIGSLGTVRGNGTIIANVQNIGGTVAPGTSPGTLRITGSYGQNDGGKLQIELASPTSFDKLSVSGNLSLQPGSFAGAVLQVSLADGYVPHGSQSFDILDWGSLSGVFEQVQLPTLGGILVWDKSLLHTNGRISVIGPAATPLAGDFDENGVVNGADLTRWKAGFGTGTTHVQGDADADGDVDGDDFLVWQRQVGRSSIVAAGEQVPEPVSTATASLAASGLALLRPRRRSFSPGL